MSWKITVKRIITRIFPLKSGRPNFDVKSAVTSSSQSHNILGGQRQNVKMSTVQELEQQKRLLEDKIHKLVQKLEVKKKPDEIKLTDELVIKPKDDLGSDLEALTLEEDNKPKLDTAKSAKPETKSKQKGGCKEPSVPEKPIDVSRLDLRIGKILEVSLHPDADSLYVEKIDCGDQSGPRTVISGLVKHVPIDDMRGRSVVVLCNLKPAKMRGILSEAMVMCASTPEKVELLQPPDDAKPGDKIVFDNYPGEPDAQLNPKKKIWEQVSVDIKTNTEGIAMYKECQFKLSSSTGQFKSNLKNVHIR